MKKNFRYFLVSYNIMTKNQNSNGNLYFQSDLFPNIKWIKSAIKEFAVKAPKFEQDDIVVQNIFEFKNQEDFENFSHDN